MAKVQTRDPLPSTDATKTSYDKWVEGEGIPQIKTFFVEDIRDVKLEWWQRKGGDGAFLQMEGAGQVNNCYICEIPPGKSLKPQRQLFEETIYIISGRGATTVWHREDQKQTFEWQAGSLFSPPLNTWHQLFNGSGNEAARYLAATTAPTMLTCCIIWILSFKMTLPSPTASARARITSMARELYMPATTRGSNSPVNAGDKPARYLALRAFGSKKFRGVGKNYQGALDRKKGGSQIEYSDEEPIVRQWFEEALAQRGVRSQMARHYEESS